MTSSRLDIIKRRVHAVGNAEWRAEPTTQRGDYAVFAYTPSNKSWQLALVNDGLAQKGVTADFIANAPADIRFLIEYIDRLEALLDS